MLSLYYIYIFIYLQAQFKTLTKNYVNIIIIYLPFNEYDFFEINIQQLMLTFLNENIVLIYNGWQENIANNYVSILGKSH